MNYVIAWVDAVVQRLTVRRTQVQSLDTDKIIHLKKPLNKTVVKYVKQKHSFRKPEYKGYIAE